MQSQRQSLVESLARDRDRKLMLERLYNDALARAGSRTRRYGSGPATNPSALATMSPRQQLELAQDGAVAAGGEAQGQASRPATRDGSRSPISRSRWQRCRIPAPPPLRTDGCHAGGTAAPRTHQRDARRDRKPGSADQVQGSGGSAALGNGIGEYQSRIEAVPGVESEYLVLNRDYDTMQDAFKDLLAKSEDARVAENLENRQIGEQFRVLDAPRVPFRPISPMRLVDFRRRALRRACCSGCSSSALLKSGTAASKTASTLRRC